MAVFVWYVALSPALNFCPLILGLFRSFMGPVGSASLRDHNHDDNINNDGLRMVVCGAAPRRSPQAIPASFGPEICVGYGLRSAEDRQRDRFLATPSQPPVRLSSRRSPD